MKKTTSISQIKKSPCLKMILLLRAHKFLQIQANFNFSNQECSLPQDDLTFEGHTSFFKSTCKFTCVKYKHRHLCHSKISIELKLYWLCINNPKFGQIVTTSLHFEIFFLLCEWQGPLVLIMCTFSLIIYFALF